ncbi:hypothetical protein N7G274_005079 [Stereocaulon virgatum]|uniref:Protein kinase domain-containing protein n=1 Tax=Stereocaulon virgatum TaxID=373712 RepID=A0ABR4A7K8_9LECA
MPIFNMTVLEQVMMQVMAGVLFMHQKGVLHRDIKPDNTLVARKTPVHAVPADLGWAASLDDEYALRRRCGTVGFNAPRIPEEGSSDTLQTTAIDVFSLGATFLFMIEPDRYKDATFIAALVDMSSRPPKFYAELVLSMLAPKPQDRPSLETCLEVVNKKMYTWTKESQPMKRTSIRRSTRQEAVSKTRSTSLRVRQLVSPLLRIPTANIAAVQDPIRLSPAALMEKTIKPKTMQPPQNPVTRLETATNFTTNQNPRPKAKRMAVNLERQVKTTETAANRVGDVTAQRTHWARQYAKAPRNRLEIPAPQAKEAKINENVVRKDPTAAQAPVDGRPSPRTQQLKKKGPHSRQILASTHEPLRTIIGKLNYNINDHLHRRIRRHPARERLIYDHAQIQKRAKQLLRGLWYTCMGVADRVAAVTDMVVGCVGLPLAVGEAVFNTYRANRALNGMTYDTAGFGCNPDGRLIYGLHSRALKPLSITGYKAERLRSYQTWADSDEASCFSNRTRKFVAEHRATNPQEY